jgi:hypothetical protein
VASARRQCLYLYFYFLDRDFGLMHVRLQTWFPLQIQVDVNGHEWLARTLARAGIGDVKQENVFVRIDDLKRAQRFSDRFNSLDWPRLLGNYARMVNPLKTDLLRSMDDYRVTAQSEYSTDTLFKSPAQLRELYPRLLSHSTLGFGAREVMSFPGRPLHPFFQGEVVSDVCDLSFKRIPGARSIRGFSNPEVLRPTLAGVGKRKTGRKPKNWSSIDQHYENDPPGHVHFVRGSAYCRLKPTKFCRCCFRKRLSATADFSFVKQQSSRPFHFAVAQQNEKVWIYQSDSWKPDEKGLTKRMPSMVAPASKSSVKMTGI